MKPYLDKCCGLKARNRWIIEIPFLYLDLNAPPGCRYQKSDIHTTSNNNCEIETIGSNLSLVLLRLQSMSKHQKTGSLPGTFTQKLSVLLSHTISCTHNRSLDYFLLPPLETMSILCSLTKQSMFRLTNIVTCSSQMVPVLKTSDPIGLTQLVQVTLEERRRPNLTTDSCEQWNRGVCCLRASECKYCHVCKECSGKHDT